MKKQTRRRFLKAGGTAALATLKGPFFIFPERMLRAQGTLRITQWSHFVPAYDHWFDMEFSRKWGEDNDVNVVIDHISLGDLPALAAAQAAAQKGSDLFMFLSSPISYKNSVIDVSDLYQEARSKYGRIAEVVEKSTFNPKDKTYLAFAPSFAPTVGIRRPDLWESVGYAAGPATYGHLRDGARKIKDKSSIPCGLGLSRDLLSTASLGGILQCFGGSIQDEEGNVVIGRTETIEALKYMSALYRESELAEVLTWSPLVKDRVVRAGQVSYTTHPPSAALLGDSEPPVPPKPPKGGTQPPPPAAPPKKIGAPLEGPAAAVSLPSAVYSYVIWRFAQNKDGAKRFLLDLVKASADAFGQSKFLNFPSFGKAVPDLKAKLSQVPVAHSVDDLSVLADAPGWSRNLGYPGYDTESIALTFGTWVIPTMFARVARGDMDPADAARTAEAEIKRISRSWK